jgi:signal transduction histidine kinase
MPSHYEIEGVKKDGSPVWCGVVARLIRWNGELAIQTTFTDITDRKRTEAELIDAKMESIGMMARGIAEEFNSIYTSILGTISMAKMEAYGLGENRIVEILSEAERTSAGAKKVIEDLMVLNRAGIPVKERVTVEEMLKEVFPLSGSGEKVVPIRPSRIRINLNLAANLWAVNADKMQVNQAFGVLISNGLQATPGGGVLGISAENVEFRKPNRTLNLEPGKYVKVTIRDQGTRIPPQLLKKIFDPYFSPHRENAGMGLASAFSIVRQHAGTIKVNSNMKAGNRFQVFLPAHIEIKPSRKGTRRRTPQQRPHAST